MKNLFLLFALFLSTGIFQAQEGVKVDGNSVSTREIAPVWPGCEKSKLSSKDCFNQQMNVHLKNNFKYPKDSKGNIVRGATTVAFTIDETGGVTKVSAEGPAKQINEEVIRVLKLMPKMEPGKRGGKPVPIKHRMAFNL